MFVLGWFTQIINAFRNININVFGFDISMFHLLFGTLIFSALCRGFIKIILEQK